MKKSVILCTLAAIVAFCAGYSTNQIVVDHKASCEWPYANTNEETLRYYKEAHEFCTDLLDVEEAALRKANEVMENNDLFDTDGSDEMAEYLELSCKADSILMTQR